MQLPVVFLLSSPFPTQCKAAVTTVGSEKPSTFFTVRSTHGLNSSISRLGRDIINPAEKNIITFTKTRDECQIITVHVSLDCVIPKHDYIINLQAQKDELIHSHRLIHTVSPETSCCFCCLAENCANQEQHTSYNQLVHVSTLLSTSAQLNTQTSRFRLYP